MKICFLGNAQSIHLQRWASYFIENGHIVHIITMEPFEIKGAEIYNVSFLNLKKEIPNIRFVGYLIHKYREYKSILVLKSYLNKIKPDILNSHYMTIYGILGSKLDFHPSIITCWGSDVLITPNKLGKTYINRMKKAFRTTDRIVVESNYMKKEVEKFGIDKGKIILNPCGIDTDIFTPRAKLIDLRSLYDFNDGPILINTRNLEDVYNQICLLKAIRIVKKRHPRVNLLIAGEGSKKDELEKKVKELKICENVRFLGFIDHHKLPSYLVSSDIYISTALSEGMGKSNLEALSTGTITIVLDVPVVHEYITPGVTGFIVKNDPKALAEKIIDCIDNYIEYKRLLSKNSIKMIDERYNWRKNINEIEGLYREVAKNSHSL
jgi:glycosyltransferase involved in cell wall biosynthesis